MTDSSTRTGRPLTRLEDVRFLTGAGTYVDDIHQDGQAHAWVLRSPHAHAVIRSADAEAARACPGVLSVVLGADLADQLGGLGNRMPMRQSDGSSPAPVEAPVLAHQRVLYVGQPVAFVTAETLAAARDAAELVQIEYDELPVATTAEAALAPDAPQLHEAAPGNRAYHWEVGDRAATEEAFAGAPHTTRLHYHCHRIAPTPVEPRAVSAVWDAASGRWTLHCVSQGAHGMRSAIAACLRTDPTNLRVITPDVGGAFGMKLMLHPEYVLAAWAARECGRPVKWTADRSESFLSDVQGRDLVVDAEGAFDAEGRILAFRLRGQSNLGAHYSQFGAAVHTEFSMRLTGGMYRTPTFFAEVEGAFTNTTPTDAYRGAGRPEVIAATELLVTRAARELGLDQAEMRRRNLLAEADFPHRTPGGLDLHSGDPIRNLEDALAAADYAGFESRRQAARDRGGIAGIGVAYYMERTGGMPKEHARLVLGEDGALTVAVGTQSGGQGHETVWAQLLEDSLGIAPGQIRLRWGDTDLLPEGHGTGGSRSAKSGGPALRAAARSLIEEARQRAGDRLEAAAVDLEFEPQAGGSFVVAGTDRRVGLAELAADGELAGDGRVEQIGPTFPNGCHICEIVIDPATGGLEILRYVVVDDFGILLNPRIVAGQIHGGIAQGVGQTLCEEAGYDPDSGQPVAASFMDYAFPRADQLPSIDFRTHQIPAHDNELGVKGCGESGTVGSLPCLHLAALDALAPYGIQSIATPLSQQRLWQALRETSGSLPPYSPVPA